MAGPDPLTTLDFRSVVDGADPDALPDVFDAYWPAYRAWIRRAPSADPWRAVDALRSHLPGLIPAFDQLLDRLGGDAEVARFLSLYDTPPVIRGCSQLILDDGGQPVLLRAYDHDPQLFDGLILASRWGDTPVLAVTDCLWGALDGMNGHGLAAALAFGGRDVAGPGFAAPLVVRHLLESCATVADARAALTDLPVGMPYTFVVVDAAGDRLTAHLGPDRPAVLTGARASTNHQGTVEWPEYCARVGSETRLARLDGLIHAPRRSAAGPARRAFLAPPLWRPLDDSGSGTLYTVEYRPAEGRAVFRWPDRAETFDLAGDARQWTVDLPAGA